MTLLFLHIATPSHFCLEKILPYWLPLRVWVGDKSVGLWTGVHHPPPDLPASEIGKLFLSTNLAGLLF